VDPAAATESELPDAVIRYDDHADAMVDLRLPSSVGGPGLPRLVVLIHGGFWRVEWDRVHIRPLGDALARAGFVVAMPEYRRIGGVGDCRGGWPNTFDDVRKAIAALPGFLRELSVSTSGTTVMGHSAGGHLALWLASEAHQIDSVVGLAPVGDLRAAAEAGLDDGAVIELLGGTPGQVPQRYDAADPATRLAEPPGCSVDVVHGTEDDRVPVEMSRRLAQRHPHVTLHELPGVEHFALIDPLSPVWPVVRAAAAGGLGAPGG
jgi:acetyl esterase/lipase